MKTTTAAGTMFGGSSRNPVEVEFDASADKKTVRISFDNRRARVSLSALREAVKNLPKTGAVWIPASRGAQTVSVAPKSNTVEVTLRQAEGTGLDPVVRVGLTVLRRALADLLVP